MHADHCPTDVSDTPFDPHAFTSGPVPTMTDVVATNPTTGNSRRYKDGVLVEQSLKQGCWQESGLEVPRRPGRPEPKSKNELLATLDDIERRLDQDGETYKKTVGTNPLQDRIIEQQQIVASLRARLAAADAELQALLATPTPSQKICNDVAEATQATQAVAREAHLAELYKIAKTKHDISDPFSLDKPSLRIIENSDRLKSLKVFTSPFFARFAKNPSIDQIETGKTTVYDALEQLREFLK